MEYKIYVTEDAEKDLDCFINYLLFEKLNEQAAANLLDDFEITKNRLSLIAGSLKLCNNEQLKSQGYRRINFTYHNYFMIYHLDGNRAIIDNIFHELQDYENKLN